MANVKDLALALEMSNITLIPVEERIFLESLNNIEKRILKFVDESKEARGLYEFY